MNNLNRKVDELELSIRVMSALKTNGINTIQDIVIRTDSELLRLPNFGIKSLNEIKEVLSHMDLKTHMDLKMGGTNGEAKINGEAKKTPSFFKEYNKEVIIKIEKVALASLNYMVEKKEWDHSKVPIIFNEHRKIIDTYEKAILDLWGI